MELFLKKKDIRYGSKIQESKGLSGTAAWPMAQYFFVPSARRQCRTDLLTPESQEERKDKDMVLFQLAFWAVVKFKFV